MALPLLAHDMCSSMPVAEQECRSQPPVPVQARTEWMVGQPAQLAQATSQTSWCADVERALAALDRPAALAGVKRGCVAQLVELAAMVRAELAPVARLSVASLITLSVHARDVTAALLKCAPAVQGSMSASLQIC